MKISFEKGYFTSLAVATLLFCGVGAALAWTPAPSTPPKDNVEPPITVASTAQYKKGVLGLNGLAVFGKVQIVDGTQGAGKVLMSDAQGRASWQPLPQVNSVTNITNNLCQTPIFASLTHITPNNTANIKKVATLQPGTYKVEGSGSSYNTGGGGVNSVVLSEENIADAYVSAYPASITSAWVGYIENNCTSCAIKNKIMYGPGGANRLIYIYNRNGYNDGTWSIPKDMTITVAKKMHVYLALSQAGATGNLEFTQTNCK
ncbi:MAG: hypothetical protein FGM57_00865 [Candidatus Taylorbacteria bacterium]|nr:hypothetical protein [Candidatus Taylorbacteria bacterium]